MAYSWPSQPANINQRGSDRHERFLRENERTAPAGCTFPRKTVVVGRLLRAGGGSAGLRVFFRWVDRGGSGRQGEAHRLNELIE